MKIDLAGRLDEIAAGRAWYGSALAEAIKKPYLSDAEKERKVIRTEDRGV